MKEFKVNNFDLLRLLAALEVLLLHTFAHLKLPQPFYFKVLANFPGVVMFFIMSGYLISASWERNSDLRKYATNRALRIYPGLIACILVTIVVISAVAHISFLNKQAFIWAVLQCIGLIYTPGFLMTFGFGSYNGSLWTIPLELQFYVLLPILYYIISKFSSNYLKKTYLVIVAFVIFAIISYIISWKFTPATLDQETMVEKIIRYSFASNFYLFLLGVLLQRFKVFQSKYIYGKGLIWVVVYILINQFVPQTTNTYIFKCILLGFVIISLAYTMPTVAHKILRGNDLSYGVYIYHGLVLGVFVELQLFNNYAYVPLLILLTFILAALSWWFVEKPFIRKKFSILRPAVA